MHPLVENHREDLAILSRNFGVRRLAVFGSATRSDFDPSQSDVDFLAEFEDPLTPGYADRFLDFAMATEALLGRKVDLITARSLTNPFFRSRIEQDLEDIYVAA